MTVDEFIDKWGPSGGAEMANAQPFILDLCDLLGTPRPEATQALEAANNYVFEKRVEHRRFGGKVNARRIDCYKRDHFILEAKQSSNVSARPAKDDAQGNLLPEESAAQRGGTARRGTAAWDQAMRNAYNQAKDYISDLPNDHDAPPFLLVVDVGYEIHLFSDFSGQGRNYSQFPDRRSFRIPLEDLRDEEIRSRLRTVWEDPHSLDPARRSAEVTADIARRLANIAKALEGKHDPRDVAEFLMRCLFTMFAEDVGLLPQKAFESLLSALVDDEKSFVPALEHLWKVMDEGGYEPRMSKTLKRFNGALFKQRRALPLAREQINELWVAARQKWDEVEPAIFGTLLERALDPRERSKLGAHYTPRTYVERLVVPTVIEPLREDWVLVQTRVNDLLEGGEDAKALRAVRAFHRKLCTTRVLDPACGTGNFLYVALELMKRLEGEVLELLAQLGGGPSRLKDHPEDLPDDAAGRILARKDGRFTVDPHQFYGLELNPRAVPIADLVLWIGYLKWQLKTAGVGSITEPVLDAYGTIREQDAILAFDGRELQRDETGKPVTRWDGYSKKLSPITGAEIPDPEARVEAYSYKNPRPAQWPEAEFIVGNPPFIGGKDMRSELGDGYAEAAWKARKVPGGADFVMHFWDEAATRLARKGTKKEPNPLRRFGFITTNSITQTFSRRVVEKALKGKEPVSLTFAVADHPWMKASDKAAVRIAMTVAEKGEHDGVVGTVVSEEGLNTDTPQVRLEKKEGKVTAKLTLGADVSQLKSLIGNSQVSFKGYWPYGPGFFLEGGSNILERLQKSAPKRVPAYRNGRDINQKPRGLYVIDMFGMSEQQVLSEFPYVWNHLKDTVWPIRDQSSMTEYRDEWWIFATPRKGMREALEGIGSYIATAETAAHRIFQVLEDNIAPDQKVRVIATEERCILALLTSRLHVSWSFALGAWQGVGNDPVYNNSVIFDPFPFPACLTDPSRRASGAPRGEGDAALRERLGILGERLDAHRKERMAAHELLTMTGMYNVLERVRELEAGLDVDPLSDTERAIYEAGLIGILKEIHDDIDRAAFEAYGWSDLADELVGRPGATMPSPHRSEAQEAAEEELLSRLVALNVERQEEERRGQVRWLRPDYQIPKLGHKVVTEKDQIDDAGALVPDAALPKWPSDGLDQIRVVRDLLEKAPNPVPPAAIAASFAGPNRQRRKDRVSDVLAILAETGAIRSGQIEGEAHYYSR